MLMDDVRGEVVLRRLPPDILRSLSGEQVAAIRNAAGSARARRHPIDARFGLRHARQFPAGSNPFLKMRSPDALAIIQPRTCALDPSENRMEPVPDWSR